MACNTNIASAVDEGKIDGAWMGDLDVGAVSLPLVFHISMVGNSSMDSPNQGAKGIPIDDVAVNDTRVTFAVSSIAGSFDGILSANGQEIKGKWSQGGRSFELNLQKLVSDPASEVSSKPSKRDRPQLITDFSAYSVENVSFLNANDEITLAGTVTKPKVGDNFPAIILVTGSGPQNRDETLAGHKPFQLLADRFTKAGFFVLRYDDRGVAKSGGDFASATTYDFADDAIAAVSYLRSRSDVRDNKIGMLGHSEGGLVASIVAGKCECIDFAILLAVPAVPYSTLVIEQVRALTTASGAAKAQVQAAVDAQKQIIDVALAANDQAAVVRAVKQLLISQGASEEQASQSAAQFNNPWFYEFLRLDPVEYLPSLKTMPVLALFGSKDLQVDARINSEAFRVMWGSFDEAQLTLHTIEGVNHLFQRTETGRVEEYAQLLETMSPEALDFLTNWLIKVAQ